MRRVYYTIFQDPHRAKEQLDSLFNSNKIDHELQQLHFVITLVGHSTLVTN